MPGRLLIAYATDLLVRGFHTTPPDRFTPDGRPASGLYAVARAIRRGLDFKSPDRALAIVDARRAQLAHEPDALQRQHRAVLALFEAHGFHVVLSTRPADLVATYTRAARDAGDDVIVLGCDKRLAQLVGPGVWWYDAYKRVRYTPTSVRKRFGIGPDGVADWLALVGDDTTPLDGIAGIGAKGAVDLITAHGSLQAAMGAPDAVEGRLGKALRASLDDAFRQRDLAHLDPAITLPRPLEALAYAAPGAAALNPVYAELGFFSLLVADGTAATCVVAEDTPAIQGLASVYAVTEAPSPVRGDLVGLAVVAGDARWYFPTVGPTLKAWLQDAAAPKVGYDTKRTSVALARIGVTLRGVVGDAILASWLDDPSGSAPHDLDDVARARLRRPMVGEDALLGVGNGRKRWSDLAPERVGAWACERAAAASALWQLFEPTLQPALHAECLALSDALVRMERTGMCVDDADLAVVGADFAAINAELEVEIEALAGHPFNLASTKQLGTVLYGELGLPVLSRTKTGYSTATHVLERLRGEHPIVGLIIRHRRLQRLQSNWVTSLRAAIGPDGRVHSTFHPARSFSGRLVNSAPDLGRVPGRTPEMARIRHAFRVPPGHTLLSIDYDQLGLYVLAHLTQDPALVEPLARGDDMHVATASAVLDLPPEAIDVARRQIGKVVNFATFAGQGASALRQQLGVGVDEAKGMIARFDARYSVVRDFQDAQLRLCHERGWIETLAGRRWSIRDVRSNDLQMQAYGERLARRATHEGSVADVVRRGLLRADQALRSAGLAAKPLLQILDEVLFEVPDDQLHDAARVAGEAMRSAFDLVVPLRVDFKAGPNWADLTRLDVEGWTR